MWSQYQNHMIATAISLLSLLIGRLSVSTPNHQQECAPEIEALES